MASGDTRARCAPLAAALGIDFLSEQSPESKLALGLINPALAALGMTASSTLVLLNASRLLQSSHYPQRFDRTARGVVRPSAL
jgi:cation transport ATPase